MTRVVFTGLCVSLAILLLGCEYIETDSKEFDLSGPFIPEINEQGERTGNTYNMDTPVPAKKKADPFAERLFKSVEQDIKDGKAEKAFRSLETYTTRATGDNKVHAYYLMARCLVALDKRLDAIELLRKTITQYPNTKDSHAMKVYLIKLKNMPAKP